MFYKLKKLIQDCERGMFLIIFTVALLYLISHLNGFFNVIRQILGLLKPLFIGFCIAYVLNIPMSKIENLVEKRCHIPLINKRKRMASIVITILFAIIIVGVLFFVIVPQLIDSLLVLLSNLGLYIVNIIDSLAALLKSLHIENNYITEMLESFQNLPWNELFSNMMNWIGNHTQNVSSLAGDLMNGTMLIASKIGVFITSFMISLYLLGNKEAYCRSMKNVSFAFFGKDFTDVVLIFLSKVDEIFRGFIGGQLLEATILFGLYYVSMMLLQMPYALLISALIAITSIIPYFGAMIGSFVGFVLIFAINPLQAIGFFIFFQVLQSIENNFIYPRVVGKSVGLPAIWVVIGILAFGSLFGVLGMIIAVPTCAVFYHTFKIVISALLKSKEIEPLTEVE